MAWALLSRHDIVVLLNGWFMIQIAPLSCNLVVRVLIPKRLRLVHLDLDFLLFGLAVSKLNFYLLRFFTAFRLRSEAY